MIECCLNCIDLWNGFESKLIFTDRAFMCYQASVLLRKGHLSLSMRFPTMWYVQPVKFQTSLRIRADCSEPLLIAWILCDCYSTDWTPFQVSKLKSRLHRLVWVDTCQNDTLLEISRVEAHLYLIAFVFHWCLHNGMLINWWMFAQWTRGNSRLESVLELMFGFINFVPARAE